MDRDGWLDMAYIYSWWMMGGGRMPVAMNCLAASCLWLNVRWLLDDVSNSSSSNTSDDVCWWYHAVLLLVLVAYIVYSYTNKT